MSRDKKPSDKTAPGQGDAQSKDTVSHSFLAQPTGVVGTLKQMAVTEILQTLEIGRKSARVDVNSLDKAKGVFHVHDGQIVRAEAGAVTGEAAITALCRMKEGFFRIHYDKEPVEQNVFRATTFVLLDALRKIDEAGDDGGGMGGDSLETVTSGDVFQAPAVSDAAITVARPMGPAQKITATSTTVARPVKPPAQSVTHVLHDPDPLSAGETVADLRVDDRTLAQPVTDPSGVSSPAGVFRRPDPLRPKTLSTDGAEEPSQTFAQLLPTLLPALPRKVWAGAAVVVGAVLVWLVWPGGSLSYAEAMEDLAEGRAADVVGALAKLPADERSAWQTLALGHADVFVGDVDDGFLRYEQALEGGAFDDAARAFLLSRLDAGAPDVEMSILAAWPDSAVDEDLQLLLGEMSPLVRRNASIVLEERGVIADVDGETAAILDVLLPESCAQRREALTFLRDTSASPRVLEVIDRMGRIDAGACVSDVDLRAAGLSVADRAFPVDRQRVEEPAETPPPPPKATPVKPKPTKPKPKPNKKKTGFTLPTFGTPKKK